MIAGSLEIELAGTTKGTEYDALDIVGIASLGGTLDVSVLGGFMPQLGDVFEILTAGSISGTFANTILPALAGDLFWSLDYSTNSVTLAVAAPSLSGDFDLDGDVDGRDFLLWQRGGSPSPLSASDLADWQVNYGVGPLTGVSVAVPEPAAILLLLTGVFATPTRRCGIKP